MPASRGAGEGYRRARLKVESSPHQAATMISRRRGGQLDVGGPGGYRPGLWKSGEAAQVGIRAVAD